jgi:branched-chain amino acid transport system ATP-binding protein
MALSRTFGGLEAVHAVDFRLDHGEIRGLIGPNGAGKTTLVSLICGRISPTSGSVLFRGRNITHLPSYERAGLGIAYTFQSVRIFKSLTLFENVAVSAQRPLLARMRDHVRLDGRVLAQGVDAALAAVGLEGRGSDLAGTLPYGHQRLVEIAMAIASGPELLILDEPTQGLAPDEVDGLSALLRRLAGTLTILLIEHNMPVVLDLARRITVMDRGRILAEGSPREIEANPDVRRVYLGV